MLARGIVLRNPVLRRERVLGLYRFLLKEIARSKDEVIKTTLAEEVRRGFREGKALVQYRHYNRAIATAETLVSYFCTLSTSAVFSDRVYFPLRRAHKEIITLAYGKKGPIYDRLSLIPQSELAADEVIRSKLWKKKYRMRKCDA